VNADGTELRALTTDGHSHSPSWSSDGRHVLYLHDTFWPSSLPKRDVRIGDEQWLSPLFTELYVMDSDGGDAHLLRQFGGPVGQAAWSPDGKTLAVSCRYTKAGLCTANGPFVGFFLIPMFGQGEVGPVAIPVTNATWSPDGGKLAFSVYVFGAGFAIGVGDADGSHRIQLTDPHHLRNALSPAWSPDGRQIAFGADAGSNNRQQIFVMRADGSDIRQLTTDPNWECGQPTWSPDGTEIAFSCRPKAADCPAGGGGGVVRNGIWACVRRIFVMSLVDPDAKPIQITQHDGANPVFAPVP